MPSLNSLLIIILVCFFTQGCGRSPKVVPQSFVSPDDYKQILEEISSLEVSVSNLTPDSTGLKLAYIHSTDSGRGLAIIDTKTLERSEIASEHEVTQLGGWSPDGRYLAVMQTPTVRPGFKPGDIKESWFSLYDITDKSLKRVTSDTGVSETFFFWLTTNSFLYVTKPMTNPLAASGMYLGNIGDNSTNFSKR